MRLIFLKLFVDTERQRKRAWRHQCYPLEEFSFLLNYQKPWNWINQRKGRKVGRVVQFSDYQVRRQWSLKIQVSELFAR